MYYMFLDSINLRYINFSGFIENENLGVGHIFDGLSDNLVLCVV